MASSAFAAAVPVLVLLCSTFPLHAAGAAAPLATGCARAAGGATPEQIREKVRAAIKALSDAGRSEDATKEVQRMLRGDIVRVPAGLHRIDGTLTMRAGVRLFGAGPTRTILYRDSAAFKNEGGTMLLVQGGRGRESAPGPTQVSGIAFVGVEDAGCRGTDVGVSIRGCRDFRVDHCYFERFGSASVNVSDVSTGVVDHCSFLDIFKKPVNNLGYGVVVYRGNLWEEDMKLGTGEATFVEDCVLVGCRHAVASNGGAHYVFRRNHVRGNVVGQAVDAHGLGWGSKRGTRCVEVYDNLIEKPASGTWTGMAIRGGDGVIFRNVIRGYRTPVNLSLEGGAPAGERTGYPRKDQVREIYVWGNTPARVTVSGGAVEHIKKDRDYFERPRPGYKPYVYPHPLVRGGPFDSRPGAIAEKKRQKKPIILADGTEIVIVGGIPVRRRRKDAAGETTGAKKAKPAPARAPKRRPKPEPEKPEEPEEPQEPPEVTRLFKEAESLFIDGDSERAAAIFRKIVAEHPGTPSAAKAAEYLEIVE